MTAARRRARPRRPRLTPARALLAATVAAQVAYGQVPGRRSPAATRALVLLLLGASATEAVEARGVRRGGGSLLAAGGLGYLVELCGVATGRPFGHYAYSERLGRRVGGVPLLAAAAWALMARPAWVAAGHVTRRVPVLRVPAAAAALTAWDVFLDPRMAREGYWSWPAGGRYEGIPASNFAGWLATGALVFAAWTALGEDEPPGAADDGALALYAWTWCGETFANAAIWRRPVTAAAGGAAMGAFAVPALLARLRPGAPRR